MYIYIATQLFDTINVNRSEVVKATEKQYQTKDIRIDKRLIGSFNSNGYGYGLTEEEAISGLMKFNSKKLEKAKQSVVFWTNKLNSKDIQRRYE